MPKIPSFTIRVELHHSRLLSEYVRLKDFMLKAGFLKTIPNDDGVLFILPQAEYYYKGQVEIAAVLKAAQKAASKITTNYSILITESNGRIWSGLKLAK